MITHDAYHHKWYYKLDDKIVCTLSYKIQDTLYIDTIQTDVKHRHNGYASALIIDFLSWSKTQNKNVTLLALPLDKTHKDDDLIAFYNKFGFIHDDRRFEPNYLIYKNRI